MLMASGQCNALHVLTCCLCVFPPFCRLAVSFLSQPQVTFWMRLQTLWRAQQSSAAALTQPSWSCQSEQRRLA